MIFISTGGEPQFSAFETSRKFINAGITNIELSGGQYSPNLLANLVSLKSIANFQIHNYFPPPKEGFVFNLASLDLSISSLSYKHAINAMQWAIELSRPVYSFHAGFLLDPNIEELGKDVISRPLFDREESIKSFIDQVNKLADYAHKLGMELLIENNVLSENNYLKFGCDPFLMTRASEFLRVMEETPQNVRLLVDLAHLKVSAKSLSFDPVLALKECDDYISAYHLSDNNGLHDSNDPVSNISWFWPYLKRGLSYYGLEVYRATMAELVKQYEMTAFLLGQVS